MESKELIKKVFEEFKKHNKKCYLVGGSTRDFLLFNNCEDFDFVSEYKPEEIIDIFKVEKYDKFASRFGTIKLEFLGTNLEFTTLRKESNYSDSRHPDKVTFIKSKFIDSFRRDFSINAIYFDGTKYYDYHHGLKDLKRGIIRTIGSPNKRLKQDPLRMLRAIRFEQTLNFKLDKKLEAAIIKNKDLLLTISTQKLTQELSKFKDYKTALEKYNLLELVNSRLVENK